MPPSLASQVTAPGPLRAEGALQDEVNDELLCSYL